ncbi:MarR family winged helix-turn-helix transcriptional regulator [Microbacterium sp. oral taxon 186]|jgi:DNA-binding MarR family transcriptional regulator|uniref:MarR family winged helix-turn-helix transcriptional regulator n=1 Tax=Microbacterium sp. oral taxon 186 TaxID=712383 RepID=UPI00034E2A93|nr:MarR family winged helix-turn-helix transcriptional regulator [Microbacterium sp. oral taxon 186]EPD86560.1 hypothetical protein HMPREF1529_00612 [Microbacterium sp. oral taxon 186 str. F0373]
MTAGLNTRFESDDASPGFMLWRVTNRWQAVMRRTLAPFGLTHVQFVLLAALTWRADPGGTTQVDLAHTVRTDPMMVSQVLRALEAKGLVERRVDPADARARRVLATAAGVDKARTANAAVEAADEEFFGARSAAPMSLLEHLSDLDR